MNDVLKHLCETPASKFQSQPWLARYLDFSIEDFERLLITKPETYWQKKGEQKALNLFQAAAREIPAYKDFLKKNNVRPGTIKTITDFQKIPFTDKKNYIESYSLKARSWPQSSPSLVASSSGTTGGATYWPRGAYQEYEAAITHELLFKALFAIEKKRTLAIIGFPMGVYVSGMATALPLWLVSQKDYPLTVVTAGNNKTEVLRAVKNLQADYDQVVLIGHPFFIKDILETAAQEKISWGKKDLQLLFCSEGFSEAWREYILGITGLPHARIHAYNSYGSSELLLMAYETPLTVSCRKLIPDAEPGKKLLDLRESSTPHILQYNPLLRFIETQENELLFTTNSGIPLIRFNLHDAGEIIPFEHLKTVWQKGGRGKLPTSPWQLPAVALYGRTDHAMVFYAANIYPQHIHKGLNKKGLFEKLTGKFTMSKGYHKNMDEYLEIHIELKPGVKPDKKLGKIIQELVTTHLKEINMEFMFLWNNLQKDITPKIKLWPYNHEKYFKTGLKPKYIQ